MRLAQMSALSWSYLIRFMDKWEKGQIKNQTKSSREISQYTLNFLLKLTDEAKEEALKELVEGGSYDKYNKRKRKT